MRIPISGMTCQGCAQTIQESVSKMAGIRDVQTNFALKQLSFEGAEVKDVIEVLQSLGYDSPVTQDKIFHIQDTVNLGNEELREAKRQFFLAALLGVPEFIIGMHFLPFEVPTVLEAVLTIGVVLFAGFQIHLKTFRQLKNGHVSMDTLVTLGSYAALIQSFALYFRDSAMPGFEIASTIVVFVLFGRYLEAKTRKSTYSTTAELFSSLQSLVIRIVESGEEKVSGLNILIGDKIKLRPGEVSPVDGVVIEGKSQVNESQLTGEPLPRTAELGSTILSGTVIIDSPIIIKAKQVGQDSFLGRMIVELEKAQSQTVPAQRMADRVTAVFVPGVIILASLGAVFHFFLLGATPEYSLNIFLSVLLTACPCALGLAIPTALVAGLGASAKRGILFRDARVLEACGKIKEIYFDKTGTLTRGLPVLTKIIKLGGLSEKEILFNSAALERHTLHPLAKALSDAAMSEKIFALPTADHIKVRAGEGLEGEIKGHGIALLKSKEESDEGTSTDFYFDQKLEGRLIFNDELNLKSLEVLNDLKAMGYSNHLLTGDSYSSVKKLNLKDYFKTIHVSLKPQDKEAIVRSKGKESSGAVAFVGDGINDVLALNAADVGIAVASGTPAALGAGGLTLSRGVVDLPLAFHLSSMVSQQLKFNLFWAFGYNVLMLPWAVTGYLHPMWASLAMAMSSVSVVLGSVWLGYRLQNLDLNTKTN